MVLLKYMTGFKLSPCFCKSMPAIRKELALVCSSVSRLGSYMLRIGPEVRSSFISENAFPFALDQIQGILNLLVPRYAKQFLRFLDLLQSFLRKLKYRPNRR